MRARQERARRRRRARPQRRLATLAEPAARRPGRSLATETGTSIQHLQPEPAAAADDEQRPPRQALLEVRVVLQELVEHWGRIATRYQELGGEDAHAADVATAALMSMGGVIYDNCAGDLARLLPDLGSWLPGDPAFSALENSGPDHERPV